MTRKMVEGCPKFCVKKLFTSDSVPQKKIRHAILKWSFLCNYCETPDCLTKISVELNPIKFFCNNNEIEIIGTLISFPVEWQFFTKKVRRISVCGCAQFQGSITLFSQRPVHYLFWSFDMFQFSENWII